MRGGLPVVALLTGCAATLPVDPVEEGPFTPTYQPVETALLDGDLVQFTVAMRGARSQSDLTDFADCAAAGYTQIRGYEFARHLRTNLDRRGGVWRADAVYTISPQRPAGTIMIDAGETVADCKRDGIPTV